MGVDESIRPFDELRFPTIHVYRGAKGGHGFGEHISQRPDVSSVNKLDDHGGGDDDDDEEEQQQELHRRRRRMFCLPGRGTRTIGRGEHSSLCKMSIGPDRIRRMLVDR